jgi:hypothetical protein
MNSPADPVQRGRGSIAAMLGIVLTVFNLEIPDAAAQGGAELETRLLHKNDLNYLGAFRVPGSASGVSSFEYGGTALAYHAAHKSLFIVGHDWHQAVAEISIPAIRTGALNKLATAKVLQPLTHVVKRLPRNTLSDPGPDKIGGLLIHGQELIGTLYEYYDGAGAAVDSHFKLSSLDLAKSHISGLFQVGRLGGGFVGGYMSSVPSRWRAELGTSYVTGQAALTILGRTSSGPAVIGFDPGQLSTVPAPVTPLVYYPLAHPLAPLDTQNPHFNQSTQIRGLVFPEGTSSVLFFGSHGIGPVWYGLATEGGRNDRYRTQKGPHAPPYVYQVWAYDVNELIAVKNGLKEPWGVRPYDTWSYDLPYPEDSKHIGGVAYDSSSQTIYLSQQFADQTLPVIHAFYIKSLKSDGVTRSTTADARR